MAVCHCEFSLAPLGPCLFLAAAGATCAASAATGRTTAGGGSGMPSALNGQATACAAVLAGAAAGACASAGAGVSTGAAGACAAAGAAGAGAGAAASVSSSANKPAATICGGSRELGGLALAGAFAFAVGGATTRAATRPAFEGATGRAGRTAGKTTPAFEAEEGLLFEVITSLGSGAVAGCLGPSLGSGTRKLLAAVERQGGIGSSGGVLGASSSGHLGAGASGGLGAGAAAASGV